MDWRKVQSDFIASQSKIQKTVGNLNCTKQADIVLRPPHVSAQEILAQSLPKKGCNKHVITDKETIEILRNELKEQEDVKNLLFKHIKCASSEVERLNEVNRASNELIKNHELKINELKASEEDLHKTKQDVEKKQSELDQQMKLVQKLSSDNKKLAQKNDELANCVLQHKSKNELLLNVKKSLEDRLTDSEHLIKNSEEAVAVIFEKLFTQLAPTSVEPLRLSDMNLIEKIRQVQKMVDVVLTLLKNEIPSKTTCGKLEVKLEKMGQKLEFTESLLFFEKKTNAELSAKMQLLEKENQMLQNDFSKLKYEEEVQTVIKKEDYEDLLLEMSALKDNFTTIKEQSMLEKLSLNEQVENLSQQLEAQQVASQQLLLQLNCEELKLNQEAAVAQFWRKKTDEAIGLQNVVANKLADALKKKQNIEQKVYRFISTNFKILETGTSSLINTILPMFKKQIEANIILSRPVSELQLDADFDEVIDKFSYQTKFTSLLLKFINDKLADKSLIKPDQIFNPSKYLDIKHSGYSNLRNDFVEKLAD